MELEFFLQEIMLDNTMHARWLNTLSYLEYRGFRKIIRSQMTEEMTKETLQHVSEEVRHALILKNLAIKTGGIQFSHFLEETMISGNSFKSYFYNLDFKISQIAFTNKYHAVTLAIESRALSIYRQYEKLLRSTQSEISIQVIIDDEEKHFSHFSIIPNENEKLFKAIEEKCFNELWESITI